MVVIIDKYGYTGENFDLSKQNIFSNFLVINTFE